MKKKFLFKKDERYLACLFIRYGIGFAFLYSAIAAFLNPNAWIGFLPNFLSLIAPKESFLTLFGGFEIFLALWLFSNKKIFYAAVISATMTSGIIIFNLGALDIVFRDVAILFSAVALAILTKKDSN